MSDFIHPGRSSSTHFIHPRSCRRRLVSATATSVLWHAIGRTRPRAGGTHWQSGDSATRPLSRTDHVVRSRVWRVALNRPDLVRSARGMVLHARRPASRPSPVRPRPDRHRDRRVPRAVDGPPPRPGIEAVGVLDPDPGPRARGPDGRQRLARPLHPRLAVRQRAGPHPDRARGRRRRRSSPSPSSQLGSFVQRRRTGPRASLAPSGSSSCC